MRFDITVSSDQALELIEAHLQDPRPGLRQVAEDIQHREAHVFATANGGAWDPLNPATVKRKGSSRILVDTGRLERSLSGRGGGAVVRVNRDDLFVGTSDPSAILARTGTKRRPKRDPVPQPTQVEADRWADVLAQYIVDI